MTLSSRWAALLRSDSIPAVLAAVGFAVLAAVVALASAAVVVAVMPE
ncbi:hypothetical protein [Lentzea sp. HUAS12]|nr:hypothetical protein [Lentzea sp. HUAS12]USX56139.1 hypothetical protein ND450_19185 [Lentzea sp. HUAS12]